MNCNILDIMEKSTNFKPYVPKLRDPFHILIATIISARTREETTEEVSERLFKKIKTVKDLNDISLEELEKLLYPAGFYKTKAKRLKKLAKYLIEKYNGKVPDNLEDLLKLPSVGLKTANLVLSIAFNKDAICVDTHVHRVFNRLGIVNTKKPEETEEELRKKFPKECWNKINYVSVGFGREICKPINPKCDICPLRNICKFAKEKNYK